jgi:hypothetical protein
MGIIGFTVLRERGIDVDKLPPDIVVKADW